MKNFWIFFSFLTLLFCGPNKQDAVKTTVHVKVDVSNLNAAQYGLTGYEPVFVGLGVTRGSENKTFNLSNSENIIEVTSGSLQFKAALVSFNHSQKTKAVLYYSTATVSQTVSKNDDVITLEFGPYVEVPMFNIYGLLHEDSVTPASNAAISVLEPYSGAKLVVPGSSQIATTNAKGVFSFAYFYNVPNQENKIKLEIDHKGNKVTKEFDLSRENPQGKTLPYINLSGASADVKPNFLNLSDFDGDGVPNTAEFSLGTNPFSEISGIKGAPGANCYDGLTDQNGDGKIDTKDCIATNTSTSTSSSTSGKTIVKTAGGSTIGDLFFIDWPNIAIKTSGGVLVLTASSGLGGMMSSYGITSTAYMGGGPKGCGFTTSDCSGNCYVASYPPSKDSLVLGYGPWFKAGATVAYVQTNAGNGFTLNAMNYPFGQSYTYLDVSGAIQCYSTTYAIQFASSSSAYAYYLTTSVSGPSIFPLTGDLTIE